MSQVIPEKPLRVVVWSTGTIGRHAIVGVDAHPDLELVGVWTSTPEKHGQDAGLLAGLDRELGIRATTDRDELVALRPDCVVHGAMTDDRVFESIADLTELVRDGVNVVSSGPVILLHRTGTLPDEMIEAIDEAGRQGNASLHVNGIDPGFANDVLPLVLTSLSQRIDHVVVSEIADYSTYYQPVVMRDLFGFGQPLDGADTKPLLWEPGILTTAWGPVVRLIAEGLGVRLDEPLVEEVDRRPAERDTKTVSLDVAEGTMGAVRFRVIGTVDGVPRVTLEHVTRTAPDQVPEWPTPAEGDGCYRIEITGEPCMKLEFTHHGEHGDHNVSGMIVTAQRLINAIPAVVAAKPGLVTALDLPLVTGRGLVAGTGTEGER
ncbi:diacylglycerol kinase [Nocardioides kongjuensis]|uniref:4-hydroxy-tetrahydrodipicolinate reductase n=1 Tax=Nocardioides kongjuensis TaxID=349522 RepID=A0A852RHQ1_9ACTN|nr:diacylglycerol kinase [Nocardioides kongjuensis]NYD32937.1 4-hydroxy-tetrahydrodipicolinate reductase [Nocardioides kongjuensis]